MFTAEELVEDARPTLHPRGVVEVGILGPDLAAVADVSLRCCRQDRQVGIAQDRCGIVAVGRVVAGRHPDQVHDVATNVGLDSQSFEHTVGQVGAAGFVVVAGRVVDGVVEPDGESDRDVVGRLRSGRGQFVERRVHLDQVLDRVVATVRFGVPGEQVTDGRFGPGTDHADVERQQIPPVSERVDHGPSLPTSRPNSREPHAPPGSWRQTGAVAGPSEIEACDECAFVSSDYTRQDLLGTLRAVSPMWRTMVEGVDGEVLGRRPAPEVWSALEYAAHTRDITGVLAIMAGFAIEFDHPDLDGEPTPPDGMAAPEVPPSIEVAIDEVESAAARFHDGVARLDAADWDRAVSLDGHERDVTWILGHAVHDATHHLKDVGRILHGFGVGAPSHRGTVAQINTSDGGVPKTPVTTAEVGRHGLVGDRQHDRRNHGRPLQALCLWSEEIIGDLQAEGHPIATGLAGENLTLSGIDWSTIRPGVRLLVGDVSIEISAWATPCAKNAPWFAEGDFNRMSHDRHPGWSRAYAWVLEGGTVRVGDTVVVEP